MKKIRRFCSTAFFLFFSASIVSAIIYAFIFEGFFRGIFTLCGGTMLFFGGAMVAHLIQGCNGRTFLCSSMRCRRWQHRLQYDY